MAELNAREQLFVELMNRARLDPAGEAARYGLADLNLGLPPGTITGSPKQVLAPNALLTDAARSHSQWMIDTDIFDHTGVNGTDPGQRMTNAGYVFTGSWTWGENISWSGSTGAFDANAAVFQQHRGLFLSAGHRENILGAAYKEAGVGALTGQFTPGPPDPNTYNALMMTQDFARSGTKVFVTGVTYNDIDNNNFYSIGEGVGARTFELLSGVSVIGSAAGMAAGGYAIGVTTSGVVELHITGGGLAVDIGASFTLGSSNVKLDLTDNNTIEANTSVTLTRATSNLTLLGIENISGSGNGLNNTIIGNINGNALSGGAGSDRLLGGAGNDTLDGGAGNDTADYSAAISGAVVELWRLLASNDGQGGSDTLISVENLIGSAFNDTLAGDGNANVLKGGSGIDALYGGGGIDTADYSGGATGMTADLSVFLASNDGLGGADNLINIENLIGTGFADTMVGDANANIFRGGGGNDILSGAGGADTADYSSATSGVIAELWRGLASSDGQGGADTLFNMENLSGSAFNDTLAGDNNNNIFKGGAGFDAFYGGGGIDTADYSEATAGMTADLSAALAGNDGQSATDYLFSIESLIGSAFADTLIGDSNANQLEGGAGNDNMVGAAGADSYPFRTGSGIDNIFDFLKVQGDKIHLQSNLNGSGITTGAQALAATSDAAGNAVIFLGGINAITLVGVSTASLAASDFVIF